MENPRREALAILESLTISVFVLTCLIMALAGVGYDVLLSLVSLGTSVLVYLKCTKVRELIVKIENDSHESGNL